MAHQWEHLETAYGSVRLPSAEKQKPHNKNTNTLLDSLTIKWPAPLPVLHVSSRSAHLFYEKSSFFVAINYTLCFTQTLIHWWKRNLCPYTNMTCSVAKQKPYHGSYVFTFSLCKQASRISALPDLRHVFSFQSWSHSWLSGLDYLCCSWSWRFKAFAVSPVSVHWSW